jgi:hypothetical protein
MKGSFYGLIFGTIPGFAWSNRTMRNLNQGSWCLDEIHIIQLPDAGQKHYVLSQPRFLVHI